MTRRPPLPVPDERSTPYWEAAADHRLALARCTRRHRLSHPPDVVCGRGHSTEPDHRFETLGDGGTIRSWVVVRRSFVPGFDLACHAAPHLGGVLVLGNERR